MNRDIYRKINYEYYEYNIYEDKISEIEKINEININFDGEEIEKINENNIYIHNKNERLKKEMIPVGIKKIKFCDNFNQSIDIGEIPEGVIYIQFGKNFNKELKKGIIPSSVRFLTFGYYFNNELKVGDLPENLKYLNLGGLYNYKLNKKIIPNVKLLHLSIHYNNLIEEDSLPENLNFLFIGSIWKIDIDKCVFPSGLMEIYVFNTYKKPSIDKFNFSIYYYRYFFLNNEVDILIMKFINGKLFKVSYGNNLLILNNYYKLINNDSFRKKIYQELIEKVFNPDRIKFISEKYNVEFKNIIENY
jgi:hypothetical protein